MKRNDFLCYSPQSNYNKRVTQEREYMAKKSFSLVKLQSCDILTCLILLSVMSKSLT